MVVHESQANTNSGKFHRDSVNSGGVVEFLQFARALCSPKFAEQCAYRVRADVRIDENDIRRSPELLLQF
jgi:hypothetical protein